MKKKAVIDYKQLSVILKADDGSMISIPVSIGETHEQFNWPDDTFAETMRKETIPPRTSIMVTARARSTSTGRTPDAKAAISVLVEANLKLHTLGVLAGRSMSVLENDNTVKILVINPTDKEVIIPAQKKLASISLLTKSVNAIGIAPEEEEEGPELMTQTPETDKAVTVGNEEWSAAVNQRERADIIKRVGVYNVKKGKAAR